MATMNQLPSKEIIFHKSATFMDYLHGDVKDGEALIACLYEYARESKDMWDAAKLLDDARASGNLNCEKDFWRIHFEFEHWIQASDWTTNFLKCESFPETDWNALSAAEREKILRFERRTIAPLHLQWLYYDAGTLKRKREGGFIDFPEFDELAARTVPVVENVGIGEKAKPLTKTEAEAMVQKSGTVYYCLFRVDFSESRNLLSDRFVAWLKRSDIERLWHEHKKQRNGKNPNALLSVKFKQWHSSSHWCLFEVDLSAKKGELTAQFNKWLASREIQKGLKRYNQEKRGTYDKWKDRLKDLAAWRLRREITAKPKTWIWANEYARLHRKDSRPFHNAKAQKLNGKIVSANQADLFGDPSEASDAVRNALNLLAEWIPSDEFKEPSLSMKAMLAAFE
jgi:hypothetical protein